MVFVKPEEKRKNYKSKSFSPLTIEETAKIICRCISKDIYESLNFHSEGHYLTFEKQLTNFYNGKTPKYERKEIKRRTEELLRDYEALFRLKPAKNHSHLRLYLFHYLFK